MARKSYNTTVEEDISSRFKDKCSASGIAMNIVIETFMDAFSDDRFILTLENGKFTIKEK